MNERLKVLEQPLPQSGQSGASAGKIESEGGTGAGVYALRELTGARKAEFAASRRSLGVRERTFLQHTPQGDLVLVTLEGDHPETAFAEFGKRTDPFTMWFKQQVSEIHGMDLRRLRPVPCRSK